MNINEDVKVSLKPVTNAAIINDDVYKKLLENCFAALSGESEVHNLTTLYSSKPDVVKQVYESLLIVSLEFGRYNCNADDVKKCLMDECLFTERRADAFIDMYIKHKLDLQTSLSNIGTNLPHITNVSWKIDYTVTTNDLNRSEGPILRISLTTEVFDEKEQGKKVQYVNFSCTSQELQNLVHKLKEAARHCEKLSTER